MSINNYYLIKHTKFKKKIVLIIMIKYNYLVINIFNYDKYIILKISITKLFVMLNKKRLFNLFSKIIMLY